MTRGSRVSRMSRPGAVIAPAPPARSLAGPASIALAEMRAAISFLTRLPIRRPAVELERTGAAAFGLVGAAIGLLAALPILILAPRLPLPAAVVALLVIVVASGALHLDGLADTADALAARSADTAERARKDPRAGAVGVTAIVLDLLLGSSLLAAIAAADPALAAAVLVVAVSASRTAATIAALVAAATASATGDGLGAWFARRIRSLDTAVAIGTTVVVSMAASVALGSSTIGFGTVLGLAVAGLGGIALVWRRGRLDGDGYGAIVEITFLSILAGIAVMLPIPVA